MSELPASSRDLPSPGPARPVGGVFLVGFMGAGKTSVGRALAARLGWGFEDLDVRIESRERLTVPQIFREHGEAGFRVREQAALRAVLAELQAGARMIVALGGGAFVQPDNASLLRATEFPTIFLDAPVDELWRRCAAPDETERPLRTRFEEFRDLYERRHVHYLSAQFRIETAGKSVEDVTGEIIERVGLAENIASEEKSR